MINPLKWSCPLLEKPLGRLSWVGAEFVTVYIYITLHSVHYTNERKKSLPTLDRFKIFIMYKMLKIPWSSVHCTSVMVMWMYKCDVMWNYHGGSSSCSSLVQVIVHLPLTWVTILLLSPLLLLLTLHPPGHGVGPLLLHHVGPEGPVVLAHGLRVLLGLPHQAADLGVADLEFLFFCTVFDALESHVFMMSLSPK